MGVVSNIETFVLFLLRCLVFEAEGSGTLVNTCWNRPGIIVWFSRVLVVMRYVHMINRKGRTCTLRELFYNLGNFFKTQAEIKYYLQYVSDITGMSLLQSGINITDRGTIAGLIRFSVGGDEMDIADRPYGLNISSNLMSIESTVYGEYILIVEKYSVFTELCSLRIWEKVPVVLVTGNGFPSNNTRDLVSKISKDKRIKICYLGDYDPHGILILLSYLHSTRDNSHYHYLNMANSVGKGCEKGRDELSLGDYYLKTMLAHESRFKWIGVLKNDIARYGVKSLISLSATERSVLQRLQSDPRVTLNPLLRKEVEDNIKKKVEIESVAECVGPGGIVQYVSDKIGKHEWISC